MKKNKVLMVYASALLALGTVGGALVSCGEQAQHQYENDGKFLEVTSNPNKTTFTVGEALSLEGLVVKKYEVVKDVKSSPVTVSESDYDLSVEEGTILNEVTTDFKVTLGLKSDSEYQKVTLHFVVKDKEQFTVTFKNYDGSVVSTSLVKEGETVTFTGVEPSRSADETYAYSFAGWYLEGDETQTKVDLSSLKVVSNTVLVAKYTRYDKASGDLNFNYVLSDDEKSYEVSEFKATDTDGNYKTEVTIPDTFNDLPVSSIQTKVFYDNKYLTKVTFGANVKIVGEQAFYNMSSLKELNLNEGLETIGTKAFASLGALEAIKIPNSVKTIGENAFRGAKAAKTLDLGTGVETIGDEAFWGCSAYKTLTLPDSLVTIGDKAFSDSDGVETLHIGAKLDRNQLITFCEDNSISTITVSADNPYLKVVDNVVYSKDGKVLVFSAFASGETDDTGDLVDGTFIINDEVETIGAYAFYKHCKSYHSHSKIVFGANVKYVEEHAFDTTRGDEIVFNDKVESFGAYCFLYCYNETNLDFVLPDSVTTLGDYCFKSCSKLTSFKFGKNMVNFGVDIFNSCSGLKKTTGLITISDENEKLSIGEDGNAVYSKDGKKAIFWLDAQAATSYTMPETVEEVSDYFLNGKKATTTITSMTLSSNLKKIGDHAFDGMTAITSELVLSDTLESVGEGAFKGMKFVTKMNVPESLTSIGHYAFSGMSDCDFGTVTLGEGCAVGNSAFSSCAKLTEVEVDTNNIGTSVFSSCTGLTKATLGSAVTVIPQFLFQKCTALADVNVPVNVTEIQKGAFDQCSKLTSITLPDGLLTIEYNAFNKTGLTEVKVPSTVTTLGTDVFSNCASLTKAEFANTLEELPKDTFMSCSLLNDVALPNGLKTIGENAFKSCAALTGFSVPEGVTTISGYAFSSCNKLETVSLPTTLTTIGNQAFASCSALTTINFPETMVNLGSMVFNGCSKLTTIEVPATISEIPTSYLAGSGITSFSLKENQYFEEDGSSAFNNCKSLESVTLNTNITKFGNNMFNGDAKLTTISGAGEITSIGSSAFNGCTVLSSLGFSLDKVTSIGSSAFMACKGLTSFALPTNESFTTLEDNTFKQCTGLTEIEIPENVTTIGKTVFYQSGLVSLTIKNKDVVLTSTNKYQGICKDCSSLTTINYSGTVEEAAAKFTEITLGKTGVSVVCSDGTYTVA